ncbi:MAG: trigger factor [Bacteroidales bacterium]|nr:trigger factor [Bacteroidales bacterium]
MQIKEKKTDDLNLSLNVKLEKADWAEPRKKKLNSFRHKADIKGFRKGMAPMSLIERLYGGQAMAEVINELVGDALNKHIEKKKLEIIGEPLPSEKEIKNDWENGETLEFEYDLGLYPKVEVDVTAEDSIPYYKVKVTEAAKADFKKNLLKQFGTLVDGEALGEDDFMTADFEQGEHKVEDTYVALRSMANDDIKKQFVGIKPGEVRDVNVVETFANETDRASMLHLKKEELAELEPVWKMTVKSVKTFKDAEENQETYDKIFGKDAVKDAAGFDKKVAERLAEEYQAESDYRFGTDAREYLVKKADLKLPEAFIKRWLLAANEGKFTMEEIEKDFDAFMKDFRWDIVRGHIMKAHDLKVTKEDLEREARNFVNYQYAMYGLPSLPEEQTRESVNRLLADQQQARRIYEKAENDMVIDFVKNTATMAKKSISLEKMREMNK